MAQDKNLLQHNIAGIRILKPYMSDYKAILSYLPIHNPHHFTFTLSVMRLSNQ
jgi:hypothetical protein